MERFHTTETKHAKRWGNTQKAADHLGVCRNMLDKDRITGRLGIPFHRLGRLIRYDLSELDAWLTKSRGGSAV